MINFTSVTILTLIIVGIFTGLNLIGGEISDNSNLDSKSEEIIGVTNNNLNNLRESDFEEDSLAISENTTFDNVDPFTREFLEEQSSAETKVGIYENFVHIPDLIIYSLGLPESLWKPYKWIITTFFGIILIVVGFVLFFGRGKINN